MIIYRLYYSEIYVKLQINYMQTLIVVNCVRTLCTLYTFKRTSKYLRINFAQLAALRK